MSKSNQENIQQQEKLQALVLLDSYSNRFEPFSLETAECLLPMIGCGTLLENSIKFLIENSVEEIYLFCTKHFQQIKSYLDQNLKKWNRQAEIHFFYNTTCQSIGDALREVDAKGIIRSNFILLTSVATISNFKLKEHLEQHKTTTKTDKNAVMTIMCLNRQKDLSDSTFTDQKQNLIIHNNNKRILYYEIEPEKKEYIIEKPENIFENAYKTDKQSQNPAQRAVESANAKFNLSQLGLNACSGYQGGNMNTITHLKTINQRYDLLESQIYLCIPDVLHMFTDNFDYASMGDFVRGVLNDEEVAGYTIYIDIFERKFGVHLSIINNLNTYYYETMRLLQRHDLLLDFNKISNYKRIIDRVNVYVSKDSLKFGNNLKLDRNVFIESNCKIGENCELVNCYISSNCVIGNNVKLSNTIIWEKSVIGSNSRINACLIGSNVRIGNNCSLCENVVLSDGTHIKDNTNLTARGVFYKKEESSDEKPNETLAVAKDNYHKYILGSSSYSCDADHESDFDSTDNEFTGGEEDDDESTISESTCIQNDTSRNTHFYVWKLKQRKSEKESENKLLRQNNANDSNEEYGLEESDNSSSSSDEDSDDDGYDYGDDDDDDNDAKKSSTSSSGQQAKVKSGIDLDDTELFYNEVVDLLKGALEDNVDPANIITEINSRKHANNIHIDEVCFYFSKALFKFALNHSISKKITFLNSLNTILVKHNFIKLINNYIKIDKKQPQLIFLNSLQDFFLSTKNNKDIGADFMENFYAKTLHELFNEYELLQEECILEWYKKSLNDLEGSAESDLKKDKKYSLERLKKFIEWLETAEEEDDDDDEDDDE